MKAIIHLTSDELSARRLSRARVKRLLTNPSFSPEEVVLLADIDGVRMLMADSEDSDDIRDLLSKGVEITANRRCFEFRDLPLEDVLGGIEVVDDSTVELARLQAEGAAYIKVP